MVALRKRPTAVRRAPRPVPLLFVSSLLTATQVFSTDILFSFSSFSRCLLTSPSTSSEANLKSSYQPSPSQYLQQPPQVAGTAHLSPVFSTEASYISHNYPSYSGLRPQPPASPEAEFQPLSAASPSAIQPTNRKLSYS